MRTEQEIKDMLDYMHKHCTAQEWERFGIRVCQVLRWTLSLGPDDFKPKEEKMSKDAVNLGPPHIGDTVVLNSGGPIMTVVKREDDQVRCVWAVDEGVREQSFSKAVLSSKKVVDERNASRQAPN